LNFFITFAIKLLAYICYITRRSRLS